MNTTWTDLLTSFNEFFEVIPAITSEQKEAIFRLRYQVICEELEMPSYEPWRFPDEKETDEYDDHAVHCMVKHRKSGQIAGALRLILSDSEDGRRPFPIEQHASHVLDFEKNHYRQTTTTQSDGRNLPLHNRQTVPQPF